MYTRKSMIAALCVVSLPISITGCGNMPSYGQQGDVAVVDPRSGSHLQAELHSGDYLALAENVTNKMLASPLVQKWGSKRPSLIIGILVNNTDNENIRMVDLHDRVQEVIFNSGLVRVVDKTATSFDYIIKSELTSSRQYGKDNQEQVFYTLQLKMFKLDGELMGQWSDDMSLAKAKQRMF